MRVNESKKCGIMYNRKLDKRRETMYNTKNYNVEGNELHIGGKLIVEPLAEVKGLKAANVEELTLNSEGTVTDKVNEILIALKDGGLMVGDKWTISALACPFLDAMPTKKTAANSAHATVTVEDNVINIALDCKVADLAIANHGATSGGKHKWLGFGIKTDLNTIKGIKIQNGEDTTELSDNDVAESEVLGLNAGEFVMYIMAELPGYCTGGRTIILSGRGKAATEYTITITETE